MLGNGSDDGQSQNVLVSETNLPLPAAPTHRAEKRPPDSSVRGANHGLVVSDSADECLSALSHRRLGGDGTPPVGEGAKGAGLVAPVRRRLRRCGTLERFFGDETESGSVALLERDARRNAWPGGRLLRQPIQPNRKNCASTPLAARQATSTFGPHEAPVSRISPWSVSVQRIRPALAALEISHRRGFNGERTHRLWLPHQTPSSGGGREGTDVHDNRAWFEPSALECEHGAPTARAIAAYSG